MPHIISTQFLKLLPLVLIVAGLLSYNFMSAQWTGPTATPPGNNARAPINVGTSTQSLQDAYGALVFDRFAATDAVWSPRYCTAAGTNCITSSSGAFTTWTASSSFTVTGTTTSRVFMYSSDERLKHNITTIADPVEIIEKMRGVSFDWNKDNSSTYGLIAQEVELVLPELVATDAEGFKSVAYGNMVPILIEAIKAQQEEIEVLKSKLE